MEESCSSSVSIRAQKRVNQRRIGGREGVEADRNVGGLQRQGRHWQVVETPQGFLYGPQRLKADVLANHTILVSLGRSADFRSSFRLQDSLLPDLRRPEPGATLTRLSAAVAAAAAAAAAPSSLHMCPINKTNAFPTCFALGVSWKR